MDLKRLKQRMSALFAAAAFSLATLSVCAEPAPDFNVEVSAPPKIVYLGDSIAAGYGLAGYSPEDNTKCASYANILAAVFDSELPEQADFHSENLAVDGLTSSKLLGNLKEGLYDSALDDADVVVISIGGNDLLWVLMHILDSENSLSETIEQLMTMEEQLDNNLERFSGNLSDITDEVHSRAGGAHLFIQTLYNPFENYAISALDELAQDKIGALNDAIISETESKDYIETADIAAAFSGKCDELTRIGELDIHPNAQGHEEIARTLQPLIESEKYSYYDCEAELSWNESCLSRQNDEQEKKRKIKLGIFIGSSATAVVCVSAIAVSAVRSRRKRGK